MKWVLPFAIEFPKLPLWTHLAPVSDLELSQAYPLSRLLSDPSFSAAGSEAPGAPTL